MSLPGGLTPPLQERPAGREGVCTGASQHRTPGMEEAGGQRVGTEEEGSRAWEKRPTEQEVL